MTLGLFGPDRPWQQLVNDEPILSGRHPLHLYHGYLGAQALRHTGSFCCYDPAFDAGYPKTPVFDSGSRPAEFFLGIAGGEYRPAVYKIGLAGCCLLVPWLLVLACRGSGLCAAGTFLATAAGLLVWWGGQGRLALEAGDFDLYLTALAFLAHAGLLLQFDRAPSVRCWLGLFLTGCLGWFGNPLLYLGLSPLFLVYYLAAGTRHRRPAWHAALLATQLGALAINLFWLVDWVAYWWIRLPLPQSTVTLPHRTLHTIWEAAVWGEPADRAIAVLLLGSALLGLLVFNRCRHRAAARVFGMGTAGLWILAVLGISWEPLGRFGTHGLMVPALWFAAIPAAHAWVQVARGLGALTGAAWRGAVVTGLLVGAAGVWLHDAILVHAQRCAGPAPLRIGFTAEQNALVETLLAETGPEARILWEDRPSHPETSRWSTLLPLRTGRAFLGGLDPDAGIEHGYAGLTDQELAGRPLASWSDAALEEHCARYNVGWIVCWSPAAVARFRAWPGAAFTTQVEDEGIGCLFTVKRRPRSYVLKGQGQVISADFRHITLADVVPQDGRVVLSLHYQAGMRAWPSRVQVEREPDPNDPVPLIRLRVASPVARVTLTWQER
jgi:hypothetical protein